MAYGTVKVNFITYDAGSGDQTIPVSDIATVLGSGLTVTGTVTAQRIVATSGSVASLSGTTATYSTGFFNLFQVTSGIFASGSASNPSISITGDLDTGFYSPSPNILAGTTAGAERLRFDVSGLCVNTTTSTAKLTVVESGTGPVARFTQSGAGDAIVVAGPSQFSGNVLISGASTFSGNITISGVTTLNSQSELHFADQDSSHYIGFKSPQTVGSSVIWTLPSGDGTASQLLGTDGSGNLNWTTIYTEPSDGDKGDIVVSSSGLNWDIDNGVITNTHINASAGIVDTKLATISTANKVSIDALNIDGGTDIGAAIGDADLFIIDDGGAGTNRKSAASRIPTYIFGKITGDVTITSSGVSAIAAGSIVNADISNSAAISGTKITPNFGSQNITTSGTLTCTGITCTSGSITTLPGGSINTSYGNMTSVNATYLSVVFGAVRTYSGYVVSGVTTLPIEATKGSNVVVLSGHVAPYTLTLPSGGTSIITALSEVQAGYGYEWSAVNYDPSIAVTVTGNTNSTFAGRATISGGEGARFVTIRTDTTNISTIRIA